MSGEPGIGKTTFLELVASRGRQRRQFVLRGGHEELPSTPFGSLAQALSDASTLPRDASATRRRLASVLTEQLARHSRVLDYFIDLPSGEPRADADYLAALRDAHAHHLVERRWELAGPLAELLLQLRLYIGDVESGRDAVDARAGATHVVLKADRLLRDHGEASLFDAHFVPPLLEPPVAGRRTASPEQVHPERRRGLFFSAVADLLGTLAAERPVLLAIDDLQWADPGTPDLLAHLAAAEHIGPLTVVAAHRPGTSARQGSAGAARLEAYLRRGDHDPRSTALTLPPLADETIAGMIVRLLGSKSPPAEVVTSVAERAEGNPLFAGELIRHLIDTGALVRRPGREWVVKDHAAIAATPPTVARLLHARQESVSDIALALLRTAAVLGTRFDSSVAMAVSGAGPLESAHALQDLVDRRLVEATGQGTRLAERFEFSHGLLREVVYSGMSSPLRRELHAASAVEILARSTDPYGGDAGTIASHYAMSPDPRRAVPFLLADAGRLIGIHDRPTAHERLAAAQELLEPSLGAEQAALALFTVLVTADLCRWDGAAERADALYQSVLKHADRTEDGFDSDTVRAAAAAFSAAVPSDFEATPRPVPNRRRVVADALLGQARLRIKSGRWDESLPLMNRALRLATDAEDAELEIRARRFVGWAHLDRGSIAAANTALERCLALIDREYPQLAVTRGRVLGDLGRAAFLSGALGKSLALTEEGLGIAQDLGDIPGEAILSNNAGRVYHLAGRWAEAESAFERSRRASLSVGDPVNAGLALSNLAKVACDLGEHERAFAAAGDFIDTCEAASYDYGKSIGLLTQSHALAICGDEAGAREKLVRALRLQRRLEVGYALPHGLLMLGRFRLAFGRPAAARAVFLRCATRFERIGDRYHASASAQLAAEALLAGGDPEGAATAARQCLDRIGADYRLLEAHLHALLYETTIPAGDARAQQHRDSCLGLVADMDVRVSRRLKGRLDRAIPQGSGRTSAREDL